MSSQPSQTATDAATGPLSCTFCDCSMTEKVLALQSYAGAESTLPAGVPDHGGLTLCPDCASEVVDLITSWEQHDAPPVSDEHSIGEGYRELAADCSFCTNGCSGDVVGIELYRRVGDELPAYANYTLCENCQSVFAEFIQTLQEQTGN